jgi:ATP-dependent exoDNAse (exonuclease V) beta subunit
MVHEALRYWRFPDNTPNIEAVLRSYAWQQNLTEERDIQHAIREALALLQNFQRSDPYRWIMTAKAQNLPLYPELPFIFRTEKRILHGIIDVLLQRADGSWAVVDYKTVYVPQGTPAAAEQHAQRYALQVGAYAAAVDEQIHVLPSVYIHYIRYNRTIEIPTAIWQAEIQQLEQYIGDVIGSRDD